MAIDRPVVIYHAGCDDGFGAAWVIWQVHPDWEFVPAAYGGEPPEVAGRDVLLVDFSYKRPVLEGLALVASSITVIDHHESAARDLAEPFDDPAFCAVECVFDQAHSGAMLKWRYFHGADEPPALLRYIEDRDLWRFDLPDSRLVTQALRSWEQDFARWSWLMAQPIEDLVEAGRHCSRFFYRQVAGLLEKWRRRPVEVEIGGHWVPCINVTAQFYSDVAGELAVDRPFAVAFSHNADGVTYSLRSREGGLNVAAVAERYGGGGHERAAGFRSDGVLPMRSAPGCE